MHIDVDMYNIRRHFDHIYVLLKSPLKPSVWREEHSNFGVKGWRPFFDAKVATQPWLHPKNIRANLGVTPRTPGLI